MYAYIVFYRPAQWWGWLIAGYQLLRGIRYWQLTHCEVMTEQGLFAYRLDSVEHGTITADIPMPDKCVRIPLGCDRLTLFARSRKFHRKFGDFTPLSVVNGNHCVKHTRYILNMSAVSRLPGALAHELEGIYEIN